MNVKGSAFIARQKMVTEQFGEAAWKKFIEGMAAAKPLFGTAVLPVTQIPAEDFVFFNRKLIERFFGNDVQANWKLGEKAAEWALREGPYRGLLGSRDFRAFAETAPRLWTAYYDVGRVSVVFNDKSINLRVDGCPLTDLYFEYGTVGYFKRGFELAGGDIKELRCHAGFSKGDKVVHYEIVLG